jgi:hypothetical protein
MHTESTFNNIMNGLHDVFDISNHKYWVIGVFQTNKGREYQKLLFSGNDLAEAEERADDFAHSSALTLKPSRVFLQHRR